MVEEHAGEGLGDGCGRIAKAEYGLVNVALNVVNGKPDEPTDRMGMEEDQGAAAWMSRARAR